MTQTYPLSFNLWMEPWITLEHDDGHTTMLGIEQVLLRAHEYRFIYEASPLAVVGIHRLLTAIAQAMYQPRNPAELQALWNAGRFDPHRVASFGERYAHRFDLFSDDAPFMQSGDLPLRPDKSAKTIAYLSDEIPAGTAITHYRHGSEDAQAFCPSCVAIGLVNTSAFASSGGAGIKPSINGVPPIYVVPVGRTLFHSLSRSVLLKSYQPSVATQPDKDAPAWSRASRVQKSTEITEVGYLQSLTFPARRMRLYPEGRHHACTRCGQASDIAVGTLVFEMGLSRPKDAPFWNDPFAAYRVQEGKPPVPIRPIEGKVLWREFSSLFLREGKATKKFTFMRPRVLDQLSDPYLEVTDQSFAFRCVGLRTDMKAKIFEWLDATFDVPTALLVDVDGGLRVREAITFAEDAASTITSVFRTVCNSSSRKGERHKALGERMHAGFWSSLAEPFRQFVLALPVVSDADVVKYQWFDIVVTQGNRAFVTAIEQIGDDAVSLRERVKGEDKCRFELNKLRKRYLPQSAEDVAAKAKRQSKRKDK